VDLNLEAVNITNNEEAQRFEAQVDGLRAILTYRRFPDRMVLNHTEVPRPLEGKGLAAKLARTALDFARVNQLRVVPLCPYIAAFIRRHAEYQDLVSTDELRKLLSRSRGATGG
jgi:predicted GNAT family acetyltransferase